MTAPATLMLTCPICGLEFIATGRGSVYASSLPDGTTPTSINVAYTTDEDHDCTGVNAAELPPTKPPPVEEPAPK